MVNIAFTGALLMLQDAPRQLTMRISGDRISSIGGSPQPGDKVIDLTGHAIFPGLINAHDHLELNVFPRTKLQDRYDHARSWYQEMEEQTISSGSVEPGPIPFNDRLFIGGIKNLLAGVTSVAHHGELYRILRSGRFAVRVVQRYGWAQSLFIPRNEIVDSYFGTPSDAPWIIHLAEGITIAAGQELERLDRLECLRKNTVLVHGVGLSDEDIERIIEVNAGLIWCPESNRFLLGEVRFHAELAGRMALGTDSRMAGSLDLLAELKLAAHLSVLPPRRLIQMVLADAARLLHLRHVGGLARDFLADLVVVSNGNRDPYQVLLDSHRADLRLVMLGGRPRIADRDFGSLFRITRVSADSVQLDGVQKLLARDLYNRFSQSNLEEPGLELL